MEQFLDYKTSLCPELLSKLSFSWRGLATTIADLVRTLDVEERTRGRTHVVGRG
jgi:hypothetical protein